MTMNVMRNIRDATQCVSITNFIYIKSPSHFSLGKKRKTPKSDSCITIRNWNILQLTMLRNRTECNILIAAILLQI